VIPVVVDRAALDEQVRAGREIVLADVRWYLDGRDGRAAYEAGHLPGAVWVDLEHDLAAPGLPATQGRHPFPSPEAFAAAMGRLGIGDDALTVAYDDTGGLTAGRLVVMLRMLGRDAALLDGGLRRWDGPLESGWVEPAPRTSTVAPWPSERLASADETAAVAADPAAGVVLDARTPERFTGEVALIDPRPGHVPGARNAPWSEVLDADGRIRSVEALRAHFEAAGATGDGEVVTYCGSGVSACMNIVAMEHAGLRPPRLYVASWSGWSADPARPAATGG